MHPITAQDTPPVLRVSSHLLGCRLVFRRLPFLNHRHYRRCCHLKFAGGFFCVVPLHSNTCIISLCFYWFFHCIGFIITFPFLYLLMVLQYNPRRVFWFLCAGSLLDLFFVFWRVLGRVKNERKRDESYWEKTASHLLVIASGVLFVVWLLFL